MSIITAAKAIKSRFGALRAACDVRDFHVYGGLIVMGYGLYLLRPWLGFAVPGAILLCIGMFVGKRVK
jgi:hypothetical protein